MRKTTGEKIKQAAKDVPPCPYCSNPHLFEDALALPVTSAAPSGVGQRAASFWRRTPVLGSDMNWKGIAGKTELRGGPHNGYFITRYTEKDFIDRLKGFSVILLGHEVEGSLRHYLELGPFFFSGLHNDQERRSWVTYLHYAARVTHKESVITIDIHWWPSHGRLVTVRDIPQEGAGSQDLKFINETMKLLRAETRGAGQKITSVDVVRAIQKLGKSATQAATAKELGVAVQSLREFRRREAAITGESEMSWEKMKERFLQTEIV